VVSRSSFTQSLALGGMALEWLLAHDAAGGSSAFKPQAGVVNPLAPRKPHFAPKAKNVIFMFMEGGPSQIDLFDPKPKLIELNGKTMPESYTKGQRNYQGRWMPAAEEAELVLDDNRVERVQYL